MRPLAAPKKKRVPAVVLAAAVIATTLATAGQAMAAAPDTIAWGPCPPSLPGPSGQPGTRDPRQQCARMTVPLNYLTADDHRTIELEISRIPAARPDHRRGVLVTTPGGPGGPGLDRPSSSIGTLPTSVTDSYDLVGMDYRGIGHSTPVACGVAEPDRRAVLNLPFPAPDGDISANVAFAQRIAAACAANAGDYPRYLTTANIARDLDGIRAALGERRISYVGTSYATYLGQVYASLFPTHLDHMVLDSSTPPGGVQEAVSLKGLGVQDAFPDFAAWAAANAATYRLGDTPEAVRDTYFRVTSALDTAPTTAPSGTVVDGNTVRAATTALLEQTGYFPSLARILQFANTGSAPTPSAAAVPLPALLSDNFVSAQDAIVCGDTVWPRSVEHYAIATQVDRWLHPLTNGMAGNIWPCAFWPFQRTEPPVRITGEGPRTILMLQNRRAPSTAYAGALRTRWALGGRAQLITVDAEGHGVSMVNPCVRTALRDFFATDRLDATDRWGTIPRTV
ncbi:alpha/beta hydrolase, partial [Solihabitans fulvus]